MEGFEELDSQVTSNARHGSGTQLLQRAINGEEGKSRAVKGMQGHLRAIRGI